MLLILADPDDPVARGLGAFVRNRGVATTHATDCEALQITVTADRDSNVSLNLSVAGRPVGSIMNRYYVKSAASQTLTDQFVANERLATMWTSLALFAGPVINRPNERGMFPVCGAMSMPTVPNAPVRIIRGAVGRTVMKGPGKVNVHRLRDGGFVGCVQAPINLEGTRGLVLTPFDEGDALHVLIAGDEVLDLGREDGVLGEADARAIDPIVRELKRREARLCAAVIERDEEMNVQLLYATPFPPCHWFSHLQEQVYTGLLSYLT